MMSRCIMNLLNNVLTSIPIPLGIIPSPYLNVVFPRWCALLALEIASKPQHGVHFGPSSEQSSIWGAEDFRRIVWIRMTCLILSFPVCFSSRRRYQTGIFRYWEKIQRTPAESTFRGLSINVQWSGATSGTQQLFRDLCHPLLRFGPWFCLWDSCHISYQL